MKGSYCLALGILLLCVVELSLLLPHLTGVRVVSVDATGPVVIVQACTRDKGSARCTGCGITSDRVHSRYVRRLADRAIGGRAVRIGLSVRRLYCENPACSKVMFAEQIDGLTVRYQRRTPLLQKMVETVGVLLAGRGGARLLGRRQAPETDHGGSCRHPTSTATRRPDRALETPRLLPDHVPVMISGYENLARAS
ncbi:transposase family protein [Streptomyces aurantiacus]|uniref:transposase family protein n=1 Tax=Streptomyces aurantiacus TaxID=47760 RepID=UPI0027D77644|nr:transposase family protein [Streptomyces aurantiacus]